VICVRISSLADLLPNPLPKRGGEGIPGDGELEAFIYAVISICIYAMSQTTANSCSA
jgi:hypothetical protein